MKNIFDSIIDLHEEAEIQGQIEEEWLEPDVEATNPVQSADWGRDL